SAAIAVGSAAAAAGAELAAPPVVVPPASTAVAPAAVAPALTIVSVTASAPAAESVTPVIEPVLAAGRSLRSRTSAANAPPVKPIPAPAPQRKLRASTYNAKEQVIEAGPRRTSRATTKAQEAATTATTSAGTKHACEAEASSGPAKKQVKRKK
ncbi:hypothetical protein FS749_008318, partial [Ceratobasidium sp. UAMH 11750]